METLEVVNGIYLSSVTLEDKGALVEHMKAPGISENTLVIPYPYTEADADEWIGRRIAHRQAQPCEVTFAIRKASGMLIGVVGAGEFHVGFTREGYLRSHIKKDGQFIDAIVYGLLREDLQYA